MMLLFCEAAHADNFIVFMYYSFGLYVCLCVCAG